MHYRFVALLFVGFVASVQAQEFAETVRISQPFDQDLYAGGRIVDLRAAVSGDAVLAGQTVTIGAPVAEDVIAAGELVHVDAAVGDDVRAAGRELRINGDVRGHVIAAADTMTIAQGVRIGSFAWLAGRDIEIAGDVAGEIKAAGESVRVSGHIAGNAEITADTLELLPGARIDGNLTWRGRHPPRLDDGATVGGRLIERPMPAHEREGAKMMAWMAMMFLLAFLLTGLVLYWLFPQAAQRGASAIRRMPGLSGLLGFAVLVLTPFLIIFLFVTAVGSLLGMILLALYIVAIPIGGLLGIYTLMDIVLAKLRKGDWGRGRRAGAFTLAIILSGLLHLIPLLGWLINFWLILWGLGAVAVLLHQAASNRLPARIEF